MWKAHAFLGRARSKQEESSNTPRRTLGTMGEYDEIWKSHQIKSWSWTQCLAQIERDDERD